MKPFCEDCWVEESLLASKWDLRNSPDELQNFNSGDFVVWAKMFCGPMSGGKCIAHGKGQ